MRNFINKFLTVLTAIIVIASNAVADDNDDNKVESKGMVATGFNRLLGEPIMSLGKFDDFGFSTLGAFNGAVDEPIRLTEKTKGSALLATYVDDKFLEAFQGDQPYIVDPASLNIPLRDVPTNVDITGSNFQKIPPITEAEQFTLFKHGQAFPFNPIRLGQWLKAEGKMVIKCKAGKAPVVKLKMNDLIPNRLYSVWGFFEPEDVQLPMQQFGPIRPLGGVPNMIVTDHSGKATFERTLNFCPVSLKNDEIPLSTIFVMFHSNRQFGGTVPTFPELGRFPGNVAHVHMHFPVSAKRQ